jgi:RNA polymerase sigma-70 factor (ECF subfamily)
MNEPAPPGRTDFDELYRLDAEDVGRVVGGDASAYDDLIERHQRRAVAVAYRLLGNIEDAKDVCQDAFVRAFRSLATLQQRERFGAWLLRIVSNLALNYRRARRPNLSLSSERGEGGSLEDHASQQSGRGGRNPSDELLSAEAENTIQAALGRLPEKQKLALVLFAIERIPQKEVAEILECSVEMVKWNVFQARKTLKKLLAAYIEE